VFEQSVELPGRIEHADALLHGVAPLMQLLCAWLAGRHTGVRQFTLRWHHDGSRHDDLHPGQLVVHLADPSRDLDRLTRLLGEHLRRTVLQAPVDRLSLCADESIPLILHSEELFGELQDVDGGPAMLDRLHTPAGQREHRQHLHALIERLSVRLGPSRVCHGRLCADHRPEQAQQWLPLTAQSLGQMESLPSVNTVDGLPQPTWLLPKPRAVTASSLRLLAGPHRIEAGWWDLQAPAMARDYYIAHSTQSGLLWVFRDRAMSADGRPAWFVHGLFA
jgi:protein ImuB